MNEEELKRTVLSEAKKRGVRFVTLQFIDVAGIAKNVEITIDQFEDALYSGVWFDGSSIEGFARIQESDMLLMPDASTFVTLPWAPEVARLICDVRTPEGEAFEGDPRNVLRKVVKQAADEGFEYLVGPEVEFFLFKRANGEIVPDPHDAAGYFDLAPVDLATDVRREVVPALEKMGMRIEASHHEVAPGQHEIDFRYGPSITQADSVITYKNAIKTIANKYNLFASFMPKPVQGINGSGMHVHQSLWRDGKNAFFEDSDEYGLSKAAYGFIAGQLLHSRALSAIIAPTVNSYKRLVPGYEAPVYICWGGHNRSALIRVPARISGREKATRAELRCPDPSCNPYLAFAAMLAAGLDGIKRNLMPPEPVEENVYHFDESARVGKDIKSLPASLREAMDELEQDDVLKNALGEFTHHALTNLQQTEYDAYRTQVTKWEIDHYLSRI